MKHEYFDSVWDAIEPDKAKAENMKARADLMIAIEQIVQKWKTTQASAAKQLGLTQPRLNDLLRGRINKFSLDALMAIAPKAGLSVELKIKKAA